MFWIKFKIPIRHNNKVIRYKSLWFMEVSRSLRVKSTSMVFKPIQLGEITQKETE